MRGAHARYASPSIPSRHPSQALLLMLHLLLHLYLFLSIASVVDFTEKVFRFVVLAKLLVPQGQNGQMDDKEYRQEAAIVHTEPFSSPLSGHGHRGKEGSRRSSDGCHDTLGKEFRGLLLRGGQCRGGDGGADCVGKKIIIIMKGNKEGKVPTTV